MFEIASPSCFRFTFGSDRRSLQIFGPRETVRCNADRTCRELHLVAVRLLVILGESYHALQLVKRQAQLARRQPAAGERIERPPLRDDGGVEEVERVRGETEADLEEFIGREDGRESAAQRARCRGWALSVSHPRVGFQEWRLSGEGFDPSLPSPSEHIGHLGALDRLADRAHLLGAARRLHEADVGSSLAEEPRAGERLIEPKNRAGVRARHD